MNYARQFYLCTLILCAAINNNIQAQTFTDLDHLKKQFLRTYAPLMRNLWKEKVVDPSSLYGHLESFEEDKTEPSQRHREVNQFIADYQKTLKEQLVANCSLAIDPEIVDDFINCIADIVVILDSTRLYRQSLAPVLHINYFSILHANLKRIIDDYVQEIYECYKDESIDAVRCRALLHTCRFIARFYYFTLPRLFTNNIISICNQANELHLGSDAITTLNNTPDRLFSFKKDIMLKEIDLWTQDITQKFPGLEEKISPLREDLLKEVNGASCDNDLYKIINSR